MLSHRGKPGMDVVITLPILSFGHVLSRSGSHMEPTARLSSLKIHSVVPVNVGSLCLLAFLLSPLSMISAL
jgi:hypothetical protein